MILVNKITTIIKKHAGREQPFIRNLIKEELQNYILNFVYNNSNYKQLIFTGGTCLRKVYGLNRLSEDLDFDFIEKFSIAQFALATKKYFQTIVDYQKLRYSIADNKHSVYFKFPILKDLKLYPNRTPEDIFVRCDFSQEEKGSYQLDQSLISAGNFQFFVNCYDLPTLFANKIVAFLKRSFYKGKMQKIPFKGRDVYDLYWLTQLASKSSFELKPNQERLRALLPGQSLTEMKNEIQQKLKSLDNKFLYQDLRAVLKSPQTLEQFINSYQDYLNKYLDFIL